MAGGGDGDVLDAHVHIWDLARTHTAWPTPESGVLYRDVSIEDVDSELDRSGVGGAVLVQAADADEDTDLMFEAADASDRVRGVVAWVPLHDPARAAERLEVLQRRRRFCGIRSLIHNDPDPHLLTTPAVDETLGLLASRDVPLDVVAVLPEHLRAVLSVSARHPSLRMVIDHLGHPPIRGDASGEWESLLTAVASNVRVSAKVSGLYPVAGDMAEWTVDDIRPFVERALEVFGPDRLMYGSDWPVSLLAGGYARVFRGIRELLDGLDAGERAAVLGRTARRVYALDAV